MRKLFLRLSVRAFALSALCAPALAAGAAIDPDPRAPSLSELLQREDDARTRRAPVSVPQTQPYAEIAAPVLPSQSVIPAPAGASSAAKVVRQVYPSPYAQRAVTVLVPGARPAPPAR